MIKINSRGKLTLVFMSNNIFTTNVDSDNFRNVLKYGVKITVTSGQIFVITHISVIAVIR